MDNMKFDSLDSAFRTLLHNVNSFGEEVNSRGSKQRELLFQQFEIARQEEIPAERVATEEQVVGLIIKTQAIR